MLHIRVQGPPALARGTKVWLYANPANEVTDPLEVPGNRLSQNRTGRHSRGCPSTLFLGQARGSSRGKMVTLYRSLLPNLPCVENRTAILEEDWGKMVTLYRSLLPNLPCVENRTAILEKDCSLEKWGRKDEAAQGVSSVSAPSFSDLLGLPFQKHPQ